MYRTASDVIAWTKENNQPIWRLTILAEEELTTMTENDIIKNILKAWHVMENSSTIACDKPIFSVTGLIGGDAHRLMESESYYLGDIGRIAMAHALSCSEYNASMGRVCAAPTAGSNGILPAAMFAAKNKYDCDEMTIVRGLLVASCIGKIIAQNATVSGAEGGCQAECGAAAAMAAGALVHIAGGNDEAVFHGAAIALKNVMGLVCDPVAGLVEVPCAKRNASGVINALASADLALMGVTSVIPFDEVVEAMFNVGKYMHTDHKETGHGGIAASKTGKEISNRIKKRK